MNWMLALPETVLLMAAMAILLLGVLRSKDCMVTAAVLSIVALIGTLGLVWHTQHGLKPFGGAGLAFDGLFVVDRFSTFSKVLILAGSAFSLLLTFDYTRKERLQRFELPVLVLFSTAGMMVMVSSFNLLTLYMGVELQSLAIYILASFARDDLRSAEAGLKYFVLGSLASGLLLYGISIVYGFTGSMDFAVIAQAVPGVGISGIGVSLGLAFVLAGLAFKMSAVPFHMWTPDVYEGAPTPITAFMSTAPKMAAIGLLLRLLFGPFGHLVVQWQMIVILLSIASMVLGSLAAIGQRSIKRLLAYSSIGHIGYALAGVAAGTSDGLRGVLIYMVTYIGMSIGAFACVIAMRRDGRSLEKVQDLAGLARNDPGLALVLAIIMFSMAGIPPMSGFWGKLFIFKAVVGADLWTLAVVGVLTSVVGAYYYLRVIKIMYFDQPDAVYDRRDWSVSFSGLASAVFTLLFLLFLSPVVHAAEQAAGALLK